MIHEDERRILISTPYQDGEIKVITTKKECELGNHYHKVKTEKFILLEGKGKVIINGLDWDIVQGDEFTVQPNDRHAFKLIKDSILFCICSHPYDENDDYTD